ncbi:MAG TPA: GNAT family N-acetyltransferase [Actinomycetes bacterium]|nr:GNAT family N-acetyltransferase [Actinomycetes bacterium]
MQVTVRTVHELEELDAVRALCDAVWPSPEEGTQVTSNLIRAIDFSGGHVGAAYDGADQLVGATVALLGRHRDEQSGEWVTYLHSHMAAVSPEARDLHVGSALKQHQREWCLAGDIEEIRWTYDPLVRRNARFNLVRLGADVTAYLPDFYGAMPDALNSGDRTDRLLVCWQLSSQRAAEAAAGLLAPLSVEELRESGAVDALYIRHGLPQVNEEAWSDEEVLLVPVPPDITALRALDADLGLRWRLAVRAVLEPALGAGRPIAGVTSEGHYVLGPVP